MLRDAKNWWEAHGREFQEKWCRIPVDVLYGTGSPNEDELQLIGAVAGKHVLESAAAALSARSRLGGGRPRDGGGRGGLRDCLRP